MIRSLVTTSAMLLVLTVAAGCGSANRAAVSGSVSLDGEPVDGGTISFVPSDASAGPAAWGEITQGSYTIPADEGPPLGTCRVEIRWSRPTGRKLPAPAPAPEGTTIEETVEAIPARYNSASELEHDIQAGENRYDFELKSG